MTQVWIFGSIMASAALSQVESASLPIEKEAKWAPKQLWVRWRKTKSPPGVKPRPSGLPAGSLCTVLTDTVDWRDSWWTQNEQERQYMYNLTFRRVRVTIVAAEKQWVLNIMSVCVSVCVCVCVCLPACLYYCLSCPACKAHSPYFLSGCTIFSPIIS
jgi:hypothetical protein